MPASYVEEKWLLSCVVWPYTPLSYTKLHNIWNASSHILTMYKEHFIRKLTVCVQWKLIQLLLVRNLVASLVIISKLILHLCKRLTKINYTLNWNYFMNYDYFSHNEQYTIQLKLSVSFLGCRETTFRLTWHSVLKLFKLSDNDLFVIKIFLLHHIFKYYMEMIWNI